ncbi:ABC transporter ATP-binding protein [Acrocarpospora pleiomorpha]|uniref:ABC transporter ATP-binding protein n=1 Tax=Acrocarpospora pleiomorpha TaxID=90975 RepID=A0A5M3Y1U2_9ACTN|nr:ABC transporter ATP-binding protein [Acrocarpospora pleiomorpha]GES24688.1 ABC transporter ATP-binding protein [Acrocarpospora pleiomorpha]
MSPLLEARGLCTGYGTIQVVHGVDLTVDAGEIVVLLGPNGAGKSTTLKSVVGELPSISGTLHWRGQPSDGPLHARARQGISYIPEERAVLMRLSVMENLRVAAGRPEEAAAVFPELANHLARPVGQLSGGQQRMVSVAAALGARPKLLVADELSLGLAPAIVTRVLGRVRVAADEGLGVLLVEQHAGQALAIADRAMVMVRGRIVWAGTAHEALASIDELHELYLGTAEGGSQNGR